MDFLEFCKANGSSGVLLVALWGFGKWLSPRVDKLLDALIAFVGHTADLKPQLEKIEQRQATICRFDAPAPSTGSRGIV